MTRDEFIEHYAIFAQHAIRIAVKARSKGLLSLEDSLNHEKVSNRDIFEYGLRFVIDGTDKDVIDDLLSNIIDQEKDEYARRFKLLQKEVVLRIQDGTNPRLVACFINSYTDFSLDRDPAIEYLKLNWE
jgi:flagellar motor component MotA